MSEADQYTQMFDDLRAAAARNGIDLGEVEIKDPGIRTRMDRMQAVAGVNVLAGVAGPDTTAAPAVAGDLITRTSEWAMATTAQMFERVSGRQIRVAGGNDVLQRVVAHGTSSDGTAPVTIEGDLVKFVDANRYAVNAARRIPMPDNHAPTFKRSRVTQRTTVGKQNAEGDVLSSQRLQLTGDTVTKETHGGVLALSEQEIDWTDPQMLGLAIQDLAESYAIDTDTVLTAAIEAQADQASAIVCSLTAAPDVFLKAVADAAGVVYAAAKRLPDTLFVAVDRWAYLLSLTDSTGRPLFLANGAQFNPVGSGGSASSFSGAMNIAGLNVVVDPNFSTNVWAVAASSLVEFYEQDKGLLSINVPSTLEIQYAYRGYAAANVYAQGVCGLESA
jgi:hypothetical protein